MTRLRVRPAWAAALLCAAVWAQPATGAPLPTLVEVPQAEVTWGSAASKDGRYIAMIGAPSHAGDYSVLLHDRKARRTETVNVSPSGQVITDLYIGISPQAVSDDGRFVVFRSYAPGLVPGDGPDSYNGANGNGADVFLRDRKRRITTRLNLDRHRNPVNGAYTTPAVGRPVISADGAKVFFASAYDLARDLSLVKPGDSPPEWSPDDDRLAYAYFEYDVRSGRLSRATPRGSAVGSAFTSGGNSEYALSPFTDERGRYLAYTTTAAFSPRDQDENEQDVYLIDRKTSRVTFLSPEHAGPSYAYGIDRSGQVLYSNGQGYAAAASLHLKRVDGSGTTVHEQFMVHNGIRLTPRYAALSRDGKVVVYAASYWVSEDTTAPVLAQALYSLSVASGSRRRITPGSGVDGCGRDDLVSCPPVGNQYCSQHTDTFPTTTYHDVSADSLTVTSAGTVVYTTRIPFDSGDDGCSPNVYVARL